MIHSDVHLDAHRLNGTVIAVFALVRLVGRVSQSMFSHNTRIARIKRTHFTFKRFLARVLPHVDQPSGLVCRTLAADVAPIRDDLVVPFHVLRQRLGIGKDIQTDLTRFLRVPPSYRCVLDFQVTEGMASQLTVVGKYLGAHLAREAFVSTVNLQVLIDLDRVLEIKYTLSIFSSVEMNE